MIRSKLQSKSLLLLCATALMSSAFAQDVVHAVAGAVTRIDKTGKTIAIKTADGAEQVFKYTERTGIRASAETEHAAKMGALDTYFAGKEGTHVVVRYIGKGADKTATLVQDFGKGTLKMGKGTVTHVDRATRTVAVKTDDGAEATYKMGSDAVVETDHGVVKGSRYAAKEGDKVVVHYTENAGDKVVRFFQKL
jgi:arginine repressor